MAADSPYRSSRRWNRSDWLTGFSHRFLVVNVKDAGIENRCKTLLDEAGIRDYFFLDQSIPALVKRAQIGFRDGACRSSVYERPNRLLASMCEWVWLDTLSPLEQFDTTSEILRLQRMGLHVCLASPELDTLSRVNEAQDLAVRTLGSAVRPDAVCTKFPDLWEF